MPKEYIEYQNKITSADDMNEQGRKSDVLVAALEKCEKLENEIKDLKYASDMDYKELRRFQALLIQNKDEINKLKEQLKIAVECLEVYADCKNWFNEYDIDSPDMIPLWWGRRWKEEKGYKLAFNTLKELKND